MRPLTTNKPFKHVLAIVVLLIGLGAISSCDNTAVQEEEFTGNETTYTLFQGSEFEINGTITFREKVDGSTTAIVELNGTEGDLLHPVHLHIGDISADGDIAALLNPVIGNSGISETEITILADESRITYQQLITLDASIKVHLADFGDGANVVLAGGNIGVAHERNPSQGRFTGKIPVCKSDFD
ncbi:MAG: hypothetical protein AAFX87_30575 [Bacteroidota bacterium]